MDINWLGHACFRIKGKEAIIITDPFDNSIGYSINKIKADIVTISHNHPGHSNTSVIEGDFKIVNSPGEYELKGVFISGFSTYHDKVNGAERGKNIIFVIEMDGVTFCHLGDLGHSLSSNMIENIGNVGVLFLPVGGLSTIDSSVAAELVRAISPKIVIPMHFKTTAVNIPLDSIDKFYKKLGLKEVLSQPKLSITRSTFTDTTQIFLLNYSD